MNKPTSMGFVEKSKYAFISKLIAWMLLERDHGELKIFIRRKCRLCHPDTIFFGEKYSSVIG